jgi:hypothetical protein
MEALALLIAISAFMALLAPEIKPRPPRPADKLLDGLTAAYHHIKDSKPPSSSSPKTSFWGSPLSVMLMTILLGFLFIYVL